MKNPILTLVFLILIGFLYYGCSEKFQSPVGPNKEYNSTFNLEKKGPIVHAVNGSAHVYLSGKHIEQTITAHEYADGPFGGEYLQNFANALELKEGKWNGKVLFLKIYEGIGEYNGKMAVIGGIHQTGLYYKDWYDVFFIINNSPDGINQTSYYIYITPDLAEAETWWNLAPDDLITLLGGFLPIHNGNIHMY